MIRPKKYKSKNNDIIANVVSTATIASKGVANGRNIPVLIVESDLEGKIDDIIALHKSISEGYCGCQWGFTKDYKYAILLLSFSTPIEQNCILTFDIVKQGIVIDQIMYAQCIYLMTGKKGTKFSEHLDDSRILLEIQCDDYLGVWNKVFRKKYCEYLKETYGMSKKESEQIFDKIRDEFKVIKKIRM